MVGPRVRRKRHELPKCHNNWRKHHKLAAYPSRPLEKVAACFILRRTSYPIKR
jgi:hypothetical protein